MKRSAGELRAEMLRAARGAGAALGAAEDLAAASAWMGPRALADLLDLLEAGDGPARLNRIVAALDARAAGVPGEAGSGAIWDALVAQQDGTGLPAAWPQEVPDAMWSRLTALSARTYVPESEASRRAGAGAGDIDND